MLTTSYNMTAESSLHAAEGSATGGSNIFMLLFMGLAIVLLFILPSIRQRKAQQELIKMQEGLLPGTSVMTNFGLFGTVVEVNKAENFALLEVSAGTVLKVHLSTVTTIVDEEANVSEQKIQSEVRDPLDHRGAENSSQEINDTK